MECERIRRLPMPLLSWYDQKRRILPWRENPQPYYIWVSEIMLQQTRVSAAIAYFERFIQALPDVASLAAASEEELLKLWQGLGYYNRVRNLQKGAKCVMERYGGVIPEDETALRALPGVGDYTAGAIGSIAFGKKTPAVDGNVLRVLSRISKDERDVTNPKLREEYATILRPLMPDGRESAFTQALMELGALVCVPNGAPLCAECPAASFCAAHEQGLTQTIPCKPAKKARRMENREVYLIFCNNAVVLHKREKTGLLAGLWEFPNALESEEPPLSLNKKMLEKGPQTKHIFSHVEWRMQSFVAVLHAPPVLPKGYVWASADELRNTYSVPSAHRVFLKEALGRL